MSHRKGAVRMQIVIDIPEEEYNECKMQVGLMKQEGIIIESLNTALRIFVANGTPLPKGHGAIKDVSQIEIPMCEDRAYETWVQVAINAAPTIIEADIESEDRNENKN